MFATRGPLKHGERADQPDTADRMSGCVAALKSLCFSASRPSSVSVVDKNKNAIASFGSDDGMRDHHRLAKIFSRSHTPFDRHLSDSVHRGSQFVRDIIGEYLNELGRKFVPHPFCRREPLVLACFVQDLMLDDLGNAERA
ncbi:hypothetical protein [Psychromicrobium xiongbiense]|uniref:hypothetical protein n=1 Tax=Psychromicrobium xiongbiense TaxID=3051184 RepID=UPI00255473B9|nr:hypothetical protein [Psychromicrobium sp. YIM S02556]